MKKEFFAFIALIALIIGAVVSTIHLQKIVNTMSQHILSAKEAYLKEDYSLAENELSFAKNIWLENDAYTHIFIRHSEIDATTDSYYTALSQLSQKDPSVIYSLDAVQYHISSILSMEIPSTKSVL